MKRLLNAIAVIKAKTSDARRASAKKELPGKEKAFESVKEAETWLKELELDNSRQPAPPKDPHV